MWARGFRPASCDVVLDRKGEEVPSAEDESKFKGGTHAEPGHRQRVRVLVQGVKPQDSQALIDRLERAVGIGVPDFVDGIVREAEALWASPAGIEDAAQWVTAFYDRISCSFWTSTKGIGFEELVRPVISWTQMPPKGFAGRFTDPVVV